MELGDTDLTVALFNDFPIRRTWHEGTWYFSLVDIIAPLSSTSNPRRYWSDLKRKLKTKEGVDVYENIVHVFPMPDSDGRMQKTDCATMEGILRVVQSVSSPNAEPLKRWLAQVGATQIEEHEEDGDRALRAEHRLKLYALDTMLHELVMFRGITTPEQHQHLDDANYAGIYNIACKADILHLRHIPALGGEPEDYMGVLEMVTHEYQRAQTAALVHRRNLHGETEITSVAEDVGVEMRIMAQRLGNPLPEEMPKHKRLTHGDWVPGLRDGDEYQPDTTWTHDLPDGDGAAPPVLVITSDKEVLARRETDEE